MSQIQQQVGQGGSVREHTKLIAQIMAQLYFVRHSPPHR